MQRIRSQFADLVAPGDGSLAGSLDTGALCIACAVDSSIDMAQELRRLDELAQALSATTAPELALALFGGAAHDPARHFGGNHNDYYQVDNSMLNRVLDRRLGIPITLSVLIIEVGRRRGIPLHGVGMPGHFLVGSADGLIDPFHGGVLLDAAGCQRLFQGLAGPEVVLPDEALRPTPPALILKRMLFNLSALAANQQHRAVLRAARSLLAAFPDAGHREHVQHAYSAAEVGQFDEAAAAGTRALDTVPEQVKEKLTSQIEQWQARLN